MGLEFSGWILVVTFLLKTFLVQSTIEISVGHFRVIRKHPQLRHCAVEVLKQNDSVGGRISDQTGVCGGLSRSWARNQTIERGYGYAKKVHVRTHFEQPVAVDMKRWYIPGVLVTGAKVDVHLTLPKGARVWIIHIGLTEVSTATHTEFDAYLVVLDTLKTPTHQVRCMEQDKESKWFDNTDIESHPIQVSSSVQNNISFVAEGNSLKVLLNGDLLERTNLSILRANYLTEVYVLGGLYGKDDGVLPVVHEFEFTAAEFCEF